jgi:hypothetical protein
MKTCNHHTRVGEVGLQLTIKTARGQPSSQRPSILAHASARAATFSTAQIYVLETGLWDIARTTDAIVAQTSELYAIQKDFTKRSKLHQLSKVRA